MHKNMTTRPGSLRGQGQGSGIGDADKAGCLSSLGWLLPVLCWYLLWVYVIVHGFMPLQIAH